MEVQEGSDQVQDGLAGNVNESLGSEGSNENENQEESEGSQPDLTLSVQKRLKAQRRAHERETRALNARIGELESRMSQPNNYSHDQTSNPYDAGNSGIDEQIHKAVSFALRAKDDEERKVREAQSAAHVQRQYQDFSKHLDSLGEKYDDFHDTVYGDSPYTETMRDYALTLPRNGAGSAGEVLYKLGKNPEELNRIAKLHPLDQTRELAKLSHALIKGEEKGVPSSNRPLGQIKSNPVSNSHAVTEKTPVSSIRERMKSGSWK